jgi:hypothetical protein
VRVYDEDPDTGVRRPRRRRAEPGDHARELAQQLDVADDSVSRHPNVFSAHALACLGARHELDEGDDGWRRVRGGDQLLMRLQIRPHVLLGEGRRAVVVWSNRRETEDTPWGPPRAY